MAKIAVIGEAVIDRFISHDSHRDVIGGSGLNTAVAARRAGADAYWFTRTAPDTNGKILATYATEEGVLQSSHIQGKEPASLVEVYLQPDGQPRYKFALEGAVDWQWTLDELAGLKDFEMIQVGSLSAVLDPGASFLAQTITELKSGSTPPLITYDPNARPSAASDDSHADLMKKRINKMVTLADLVKVSDEDLAWISPNQEPEETARAWSLMGPKMVVMTRGADGAIAFQNGEEICSVPGVSVKVVDTVGAGDTFMAWIVAQIANTFDAKIPTHPSDVTRLLSIAAKAASITCSREGCKPPFASEID